MVAIFNGNKIADVMDTLELFVIVKTIIIKIHTQ